MGKPEKKPGDQEVRAVLEKIQDRHRMKNTTLCSCGKTLPEEDNTCPGLILELSRYGLVMA